MKSRKTTLEERLEIVEWVIMNDMNYKEAASKFSITYALVYKWTKSYLKDGIESLKYKKRGPKSISIIDEDADITQSMSHVGKCIDNGPMKGFFEY